MKPVHPGEILKYDCMEPLGLTVSELAEGLGISRQAVSKIINGKGKITPDIALRLAEAFNTSHEVWLGVQQDYDVWQAKLQHSPSHIRRFYLEKQ